MKLLLVAVLMTAPLARAESRREALVLSNCPRQSGEYVGSYRARILLHQAFLADGKIEESIEHQLRYLWGHYRNDAAAHGALQISLSAEAPEIQILSKEVVPYGRDLALPYPTREKRLAIDDAYTRRAVARGRVKKSDPALLVEYEIHFKLAVCGRGEDPSPTVRVPLPPDPWLAYWYVPLARHRPLRYHKDRAVTNPCADDDFADLPHPFYYWYDWLPDRHGPDDDGHPFDCRQWLSAGTDYDFFDVKLERISAASHDFSRLRKQLDATPGPLSATILVGVVDHKVIDLRLPAWQKLLGEDDHGSLPSRADGARIQWKQSPPREPGTASFLGVLSELRNVMDIERHQSRVDDGYLMVEANGKLKQSGRPMRVRVWLGMTDVFGPRPPRHWRILERALAEDELVIYWGHSGIGENFRLAQIEKNLKLSHEAMSAELARSPLRLVAFISCYSYMYFGQDLLAAGAQHDGGGYFVFTGMEHSTHEAGPLAVLDLVDRVMSRPDGKLDKLPLLGEDEFWLVKEVLGAR
jgi:hypothetical protein